MILLDTDVVVDLLRNLPSAVQWFGGLENEIVALPGYVVMELVQGCRSNAELDRLDEQIKNMVVVWPGPESADRALISYARCRFSYGLGLIDALVGHVAVSFDLPLHTFNQKHYAGAEGLVTLQPYQR